MPAKLGPKQIVIRYVDKVILVAAIVYFLFALARTTVFPSEKMEDPRTGIEQFVRSIDAGLRDGLPPPGEALSHAEGLKKRYQRPLSASEIRPWIFWLQKPKIYPPIQIQVSSELEFTFEKPLISPQADPPGIVRVTQNLEQKDKVRIRGLKEGRTQIRGSDTNERLHAIQIEVREKVEPPKVLPPVDLAAEAAIGKVTLKWKPHPDQLGNVKIIGYLIWRYQAPVVTSSEMKLEVPTEKFQQLAEVDLATVGMAAEFTYEDTKVTPDETYVYTVSTRGQAVGLAKPESDRAKPFVQVISKTDTDLVLRGIAGSDTATIYVNKFVDGAWKPSPSPFMVRIGGQIGEKYVRVGREGRIEIDFSTGNTLVDVVPNAVRFKEEEVGIPIRNAQGVLVEMRRENRMVPLPPAAKIIYEDRRGFGRELWQEKGAPPKVPAPGAGKAKGKRPPEEGPGGPEAAHAAPVEAVPERP